MADNCEPPEHLKPHPGWHWVEGVNNSTGQMEQFPAYWTGNQGTMMHMWRAWGVVHEPAWCGWRYVARATSPAELEAIRVFVAELNGGNNSDAG